MNLEERVFHNVNNVDSSTITSSKSAINISSIIDKTTEETSSTVLWWTISRPTCVVVFAVLTFSMILATLVRSATFVSVCMKASMNLHNKMFNAITRATMYFFNTNSSGKILFINNNFD